MAKDPYLYRGYVETLAARFAAALDYIQTVYNFDHGDEFEVAICQVLRSVLPQRFGICRGHVVNSQGDQAGDDIVIYDRFLFPTLRLLPQEDYSRKEWVPIEAVFAYIEAKNTLDIQGNDGTSITKACVQVGNVKRLCGARPPVPLHEISRNVTITGAQINKPASLPNHRNPLYTMILSRHIRTKKGEKHLTDPMQIIKELHGIKLENGNFPDAIVAGASNIVLPGKALLGNGIELRLLVFGDDCSLRPLVTKDVAFGVGLCVLMTVLDSIQLGTMPWQHILEDALKPDRHYPQVAEGSQEEAKPLTDVPAPVAPINPFLAETSEVSAEEDKAANEPV